MRGGGAPKGANFAALTRRGVHLVFGALAFRRSTLAIFGLGSALPTPAFAPKLVAITSRPVHLVPDGRLPDLPIRGCEPRPQDAKPRSAFRNASRTRPLMSET